MRWIRAALDAATLIQASPASPRIAQSLENRFRWVVHSVDPTSPRPARHGAQRRAALIEPVPASLLKAELDALPPAQHLASVGQFSVQYAHATQIPWSLQEIGRLREATFRAADEGTGKPADVDLFDAYYLHLWVWDAHAARIAGAYRLGLTDEILQRYGKRGLYTQSLFKYGNALLRALDPAIELGRSFVRAEYQRDFAPLMLMWRGIGLFIARAPKYAMLFGPVSISNTYTPYSRRLMVEYLLANRAQRELARHVKPRSRFVGAKGRGEARPDIADLKSIEDVSRAIEGLEADHKGVPVLLRQYLKMGGRLLAFSADRRFSSVLDGLMMADLRQAPRKVLVRYMGDSGAAAFLAFHAERDRYPPLARASGSNAGGVQRQTWTL
jgi:hypothetical protein